VETLQHFNLHGKYDFSEAKRVDTVRLELPLTNGALNLI
jgi:hypothetical protein